MRSLTAAAELFLGACSGAAAGAGVFALITVIGILPRLAEHTGTAVYVHWYEWAVILGGTLANMEYLLRSQLMWGKTAEALIGCLFGMYVGGLIMSLAEVLNVFPVMFRRIRLKKGLPFILLSVGAGKTLGAMLFFILL